MVSFCLALPPIPDYKSSSLERGLNTKMRRSSTDVEENAQMNVYSRDAKSARCGYHDIQVNDVPNLMQMLNTSSPVPSNARQSSKFEANDMFEISDTLNDEEPMCCFVQTIDASPAYANRGNAMAL